MLTQIQGRIWGYLYLQPAAVSLEEIAGALELGKSNVSVQIRGLLDWKLVRQVRVAGSRRDHYEAATDFWRVMQAIVERRFRWNLRQVLATVEEAERAVTSGAGSRTGDSNTLDYDPVVEIAGGTEDDATFLEQDEEESNDVSDLIGEGIEEKEEEN